MSLAYGTPPVVGVSEAIQLCNAVLRELSLIVEGEVANFSISQNKFVFFDLKDVSGESRLSCFMMRFELPFPLEDGMRIAVAADLAIHQKSGSFRLMVRRIEAKGEGSLKRAFEMLKASLEKQGLFSPDRKRQLPVFPESIAIISSEDAAGFGDFMRIAQQRCSGIEYMLAHVAVQGVRAEVEICKAFDYLNSYRNPDVIVLIRGGGSMEDLHAFNSESVARAIVRSKVPVVVGVGHERDITIADYCADVRAATPSNAAQIVVPSRDEIEQSIHSAAVTRGFLLKRRIDRLQNWSTEELNRQRHVMSHGLVRAQSRCQELSRTIAALAPEGVLSRGYTITRTATGKVVRNPLDVSQDDELVTLLAQNHKIHSRVIQKS